MARGSAVERSRTSETSDSTSVLGRGSRVRGRVSGDGDLRVEGQIEGDVTLSGELAIDETGSVTGDIDAASVSIAGVLQGNVTSRGAVMIRAEVTLEEGASFAGRIEAEFDLPAELSPRQGR